MHHKTFGTLILSTVALSLVACSPKAAEPAANPAPAQPSMADMPMPAAPSAAASGPITSVGKITAVDAEKGSVTLDHEAIPAVKWDAMSMQFTTADPALLMGLKVGDTVMFELKSAAEPTVITKVQKQ